MTEPQSQPGHTRLRSSSTDASPAFVVVPPVVVGGRERRFALRPGPLATLLVLVFGAGAALSVAVGAAVWTVSGQGELEGDIQVLRDELAALQNEISALRDAAASPAATGAAPDTGETSSEPETEKLALRLPDVDAVPTIRVAILSTTGSIELRGDGLIIVTGKDKAIPMPGGLAVARRGKGGVFVEGVGTLPDGTPVENRLGPIQVLAQRRGRSGPGTDLKRGIGARRSRLRSRHHPVLGLIHLDVSREQQGRGGRWDNSSPDGRERTILRHDQRTSA